MARRRGPTTAGLLAIAFLSILITLGLVGESIYRQSREVHIQTRQIMRNGTPSLVTSARMQTLISGLPAIVALSERSPLDGHRQFLVIENRFGDLLQVERQQPLAFVEEPALLSDITARFGGVTAAFHGWEATLTAPRPGQRARLAMTLLNRLAGLKAACERYQSVNQVGMEEAKDRLFVVAAHEERALRWGLSVAVLLSCFWAFVLTRNIAYPLGRLDVVVHALPIGGALSFPPARGLMPQEIRTLIDSFSATAALLAAASAQRDQSRAELESAFSREHWLNETLAITNASLDEKVRQQTAALANANVQLTALVHELQARDRSKAAFLASVSHELRTPLAVIKGAALTLTDLGHDLEGPAIDQMLDHITVEVDHLAKLVTDLLDAARLDAHTFRLAPVAGVDLHALTQQVIDRLAAIGDRRAVVQQFTDGPLSVVNADPERIRQVLHNLLENAIKFSPAGSTVRIGFSASNGGVRVSVTDAASPIPEAEWVTLFTPFYQRAETQTNNLGAGLGLFIAKGLVESHGGKIGLESGESGGNCFWFWLPIGTRTLQEP